tara:strand:+ start:511 stop:696 length:186 start_codon:yes stop_codon:yes gene_type:complete
MLDLLISGNSKKMLMREYRKRTAQTFIVKLNDCLLFLFHPKEERIKEVYLINETFKRRYYD